MIAKKVKASRIKDWIKQYGTIGAIKKVHDVSGDDFKACHQRVLSLIKLWRDKGCDVRRVNPRLVA